MKYFIERDGQQYGPYSLSDLQRYLAEGKIAASDMARSEGMQNLMTVSGIVGNIAVPSAPPPAGPSAYGRVPVYESGVRNAGSPAYSGPMPPGLRWWLVLLFSIATFGIFSIIWMFVQAVFAQKLRTQSKPAIFYGVGVGAYFASGIFGAIVGSGALASILTLAGIVCLISGHFSMKNALEEHYNSVEPMNLHLSGPMTFFFNTIYFQYHLSNIRESKLKGELGR